MVFANLPSSVQSCSRAHTAVCLFCFFMPYSDGRRALMGGNWKLNPTSVKGAESLAADLASSLRPFPTVDSVIFPPFPLLPAVQAKLKDSGIKVSLHSPSTWRR